MPHADPGRPRRLRRPCHRRPPDGFARSGVRPVTASKTEFHRRLGNALANDRLRTALRRALPELRERRDARMAEVDWEGLRADLTLRKAKAIDDLPALIERFTTEAEAVGAKVYRAVDAEEARRIVTAIRSTGGNALIAETGTLMLVTNEGNADLATTLPSVHIAVVGIEKIVPTIDDAIAIVKLLARSGTGQKITSYTQFITGPSRS